MRELETLNHNSNLRQTPGMESLKALLRNCLEHYYGSLDNCIVQEDEVIKALKDIGAA